MFAHTKRIDNLEGSRYIRSFQCSENNISLYISLYTQTRAYAVGKRNIVRRYIYIYIYIPKEQREGDGRVRREA